MTSNYEAWNGELYKWPPPDGWYRASDGRWWAPGSGPGPAEQPAAADVEAEAATRVMNQPGPQPVTTLDPGPKPVPPMHRTGPNPVVTGPNPMVTGPNPAVGAAGPWPTARAEADPTPGPGYTTNGISSPGSDRTTPLLAESTGPVSVVTEDEGQRTLRPFGLHPAVLVAGLLVLAAVGVAVVLAAASGNDGDLATTDDPTVVDNDGAAGGDPASGTEGADDQSVGGTDDATSMTDQGMADGQSTGSDSESMNESMDPMDDSMDATDTGDGASAAAGDETATTVDLTESLEAVTEFRATLDELGITSGDLSAEEIVSFGQSACGYATGADGLDGYIEARDEALAEADNEELTAEELSSVVDTAVRVFCPADATRLGL